MQAGDQVFELALLGRRRANHSKCDRRKEVNQWLDGQRYGEPSHSIRSNTRMTYGRARTASRVTGIAFAIAESIRPAISVAKPALKISRSISKFSLRDRVSRLEDPT